MIGAVEEISDGIRVHDPIVEFVVDVGHVHNSHSQSLRGSQRRQRPHAAQEVGVADDDVVGAVSRTAQSRGNVEVDVLRLTQPSFRRRPVVDLARCIVAEAQRPARPCRDGLSSCQPYRSGRVGYIKQQRRLRCPTDDLKELMSASLATE